MSWLNNKILTYNLENKNIHPVCDYSFQSDVFFSIGSKIWPVLTHSLRIIQETSEKYTTKKFKHEFTKIRYLTVSRVILLLKVLITT